MEPWLIAKLLTPFVMLIFGVLVLWPVRKAAERMRDGWLKRLFLRRISGSSTGSDGRQGVPGEGRQPLRRP